MAKRTPTAGMQAMYTRKKEQTLTKIREAIRDMREWQETISKKSLMEKTGLSSATFSKPYVLDLLKEEGVCQFEVKTAEPKTDLSILELFKENQQLRKQIEKKDNRIHDLQHQKEKLADELKEVKADNSRLRGQRQMLLERMDSAGILPEHIT